MGFANNIANVLNKDASYIGVGTPLDILFCCSRAAVSTLKKGAGLASFSRDTCESGLPLLGTLTISVKQ